MLEDTNSRGVKQEATNQSFNFHRTATEKRSQGFEHVSGALGRFVANVTLSQPYIEGEIL